MGKTEEKPQGGIRNGEQMGEEDSAKGKGERAKIKEGCQGIPLKNLFH